MLGGHRRRRWAHGNRQRRDGWARGGCRRRHRRLADRRQAGRHPGPFARSLCPRPSRSWTQAFAFARVVGRAFDRQPRTGDDVPEYRVDLHASAADREFLANGLDEFVLPADDAVGGYPRDDVVELTVGVCSQGKPGLDVRTRPPRPGNSPVALGVLARPRRLRRSLRGIGPGPFRRLGPRPLCRFLRGSRRSRLRWAPSPFSGLSFSGLRRAVLRSGWAPSRPGGLRRRGCRLSAIAPRGGR